MIKINHPDVELKDNHIDVTYPIEKNSKKSGIRFEIDSPYAEDLLPIGIESAIVVCMFDAMIKKMNIHANHPVDPVFLSNMRLYQDRMLAKTDKSSPKWNSIIPGFKKKLHKIRIRAKKAEFFGASDKSRVGLLYSGGFDSVYSLASQRDITDIIHITNMNSPSSDVSLNLARMIRPDVIIHEVKSPIIGFDQVWVWNLFSHGLILSSVGHLFSKYLSSIIISGGSREPGRDCGAGHDVDYLWSSSHMRFTTGGTIKKIEKLKYLVEHPKRGVIFSHIQVCPSAKKNPKIINCSMCNKCLLNMDLINRIGLRELATSFNFSRFDKAIKGIDYNDPMATGV